MDLPKEIRLEIYEYLLVPSTIALRYDASLANYDERYSGFNQAKYAESQLFLVSRQVKDEALRST